MNYITKHVNEGLERRHYLESRQIWTIIMGMSRHASCIPAHKTSNASSGAENAGVREVNGGQSGLR